MSDMVMIKETPITLAELKEKFESLPKKKEPVTRTKKMEEFLNQFVKSKGKEALQAKEKLKELNLMRLNDRCIVKLIDLQPEDPESVRMILASENITVKQEEIPRILECLK